MEHQLPEPSCDVVQSFGIHNCHSSTGTNGFTLYRRRGGGIQQLATKLVFFFEQQSKFTTTRKMLADEFCSSLGGSFLSQSSFSRPVPRSSGLVDLTFEEVLAKLGVVFKLEFHRHVLKEIKRQNLYMYIIVRYDGGGAVMIVLSTNDWCAF